jgi:formylglycine-generating enzyme required for sulfatase activity
MRVAFVVLLLLAACRPTNSIKPITQNADWQPIVETFDGIEMVQVPPGCFTMGDDEGRRDERPAHEMCFDNSYWIDRYEVTNAQFGSHGAFEGDNRPRENLTWQEAFAHCNSRDARLPSEAEWEYAARGPDNLLYPWGDDLVEANLVFEINNGGQTADVGSKPDGVSWVGAYDLSGNVWEWTNSAYARYPFDETDGREDPNSDEQRVYRGGIGSYIDNAASAAKRFRLPPDDRDWFIGFRCVKDGD